MDKKKTDTEEEIRPIEEFANYLKKSRILMNVSLEDLSRFTKLSRSRHVEIEAGDPEKFLNKAFAKSFIRAYAVCVGLDVDDTIARYNDALEAYQNVNKFNVINKLRMKKIYFILTLAVLTLIIIFTFSLFIRRGEYYTSDNKKEALPGEDNYHEIEEEKNMLEILALSTIVVSITDENGIVTEELLMKDSKSKYKFNEYIFFSITDLSQVTVKFNHKDITPDLYDFAHNNVLLNYKLRP